jgi:nitrogen fixation/metabolism regulation signal transduction histidine kinase
MDSTQVKEKTNKETRSFIHDLRSGITPIIGYVEMLRLKLNKDSKVDKEFLETRLNAIWDQCVKVRSLIEDFSNSEKES